MCANQGQCASPEAQRAAHMENAMAMDPPLEPVTPELIILPFLRPVRAAEAAVVTEEALIGARGASALSEAEALAAKVLTESGELRLSGTAANSVANRAYVSPLTVRETIIGGVRAPDPQGVAGRFMYTVDSVYNKSAGKFEVLVNELTNTIEHAVFKSGK